MRAPRDELRARLEAAIARVPGRKCVGTDELEVVLRETYTETKEDR